ncbi:extracellular solute-binding protein [Endozoicomonas sp. Mp262]|uniref:extracellular solute-binding protein n=1 Tax=Endozoicomonas sp. Mp262 TaxID=2919499 RepID=UPI0021DA58A7
MLFLFQRLITGLITSWVTLVAVAGTPSSSPAIYTHAVALYGTPKYPGGFTHFNYTNPNAPKGGELRQAAIGTFDTLNPYSDRGTAAAASNLIYDTLLARSWDEPLTKYGLLAEKIELNPDNNWVAFHINPKARFHDGKPVTARDVKFTFDLFREKGSAFYKNFYKDVKEVTVTSTYRALFHFSSNQNRELPLILGQMPVLPEHYWKNKDFNSPGLEIPIGSGPYKPVALSAGRSITYERVKDYWGKDIPVNKGRFNFDRLRYEYYRDNTVALEALLAGEYDFKLVDDPRIWVDHLNDDVLKKKGFSRQLLKNGNPQTLTITYNTRNPHLTDQRVRAALGYGFDFETVNKNQFHNMYQRADSYFSGTRFATSGLPGRPELQLLSPWKSSLPEPLFNQPYVPPGGEPNLSTREKKKEALKLLKSAGYKISGRYLFKDGRRLELEALVSLQEHEKTMLVFQKGLAGIGIKLNIRTVDPAQYIERIRNQDFDLVMHVYPHTPSPGTEQSSHWGSRAANQHGSKNLTGASLPAIDAIIGQIPKAKNVTELEAAVKSMDRILLWQQYTLPLWYLPTWPVIKRDTLQTPAHPAPYALDIMTWWIETPGKK